MNKRLQAAVAAFGVLAMAGGVALAQAQPKGGAAAQQKAAPAAAEPSAAAIAAAKEILLIKNASSAYSGVVVSTIQSVRNSLTQNNLNYQKDIEEISYKLARDLSGKEREIGDAMAAIYATHFTEQELKDLVAFYKSPLGKKVNEMEPKSIEESLGYIRGWSEDLALEINEKFREEMKKRGKDL
jgi:hypothetical protein